MNKYIIVIPAYEPNKNLCDLIDKIDQQFSSCSFVIVDDGSKNKEAFKYLKKDNITILTHDVNKGKGAALKSAFSYIKNLNLDDYIIVTADADGQHTPTDIYKVAKYYETINHGLVLGSREFKKEVPLRSRFGNNATKFIYRTFYQRKIQDNQTGLRAFSFDIIDLMINVSGDRYEYEMNVLMECSRQNIDINEIGIETVYLDNNSSSHFRPVKDFLKICHNMLKYAIPAIISLLINVGFFILFVFLLNKTSLDKIYVVLLSCIFSNIIAILANLLINRLGIFYGNNYIFKIPKLKKKYIILGTLTNVVHILSVFGLYLLVKDVTTSKIFGDIDFLIICFVFQYFFIPKPKLISKV